MSSKRRKRRDECSGKIRHADRGAAEAALRGRQRALIVGKHDAMRAYLCPHCKGWHTGHRPSQLRRTRRADFL